MADANRPPFSPLDRPLAITTFSDAFAKQKRETTVSLRELVPKILTRSANVKAELPWLKLATFGDERSPRGSLRHDRNLLRIDGVEADYDGEEMSIPEAVTRLKAADIAALVYTSPSHTPAAPRWRVLAPTSKSLPPRRRRALVERLNAVLVGRLAEESFTLSQAYYYGSVRQNPAHTVELVDGRYIDEAAEPKQVDPDAYVVEDQIGVASDNNAEPVDKLRDALQYIKGEWRDEYFKWLRIGMAIHSATHGTEEGRELWEKWSEASDHFDSDELDDKWKSFSRDRLRSVTAGTLYHVAREQGWRGSTAACTGALRFMTPAECAAERPRGYWIKGLIAPGDLVCIFGPPGSGKSVLTPYLGYRVASGSPAFDLRTHQGGVLYVAAEDSHGLAKRVHALSEAYGDATDFLLTGDVSDLLSEDSPHLAALLDEVERRRPALVVIDTLAAAFPGLEENQSESMGRVVKAARSLTLHGAAVVLIHHGTKAEGATPRGHSLLNGALDVAIQIEGADKDGVVRGRLTKNRNGSCDLDIAFRITSRELERDEDGDAITAALIDPLQPGLARAQPRLNQPEQDALGVLLGQLAECGAKDPSGQPGIDKARWRDALRGRVTAAGDADSRRTAERRAIRTLLLKGCVREQDGRVWAPSADEGVEWPNDDESIAA